MGYITKRTLSVLSLSALLTVSLAPSPAVQAYSIPNAKRIHQVREAHGREELKMASKSGLAPIINMTSTLPEIISGSDSEEIITLESQFPEEEFITDSDEELFMPPVLKASFASGDEASKWQSAPCRSTETLIDDEDCGHRWGGKFNTPWIEYPLAGFDTDQWYAKRNHNNSKEHQRISIWRFDEVEPGNYDVFATWSTSDNNSEVATDSPFTIRDGETKLETVRVDQQVHPTQNQFDSHGWYKLGTYNITSGVLQVNLRNKANGYVITDAIRYERVHDSGSEGKLFIDGEELVEEDTAVENQKDINLLRFKATAFEVEDILNTKAEFTAVIGSLLSVNNYALWVDTDGNEEVDTILEDGVAAQAGKVTFSDWAGGGFITNAGKYVHFEVHGDVASNPASDTLQLQFATAEEDYYEAELLDAGQTLVGIETNGDCPLEECEIIVETIDSTLWSFVPQGNLYVTKDSTTLRNRQLLGGKRSEPILRVNFRNEHELIDVTDLQISVVSGNADSIDRLELFKENDVTPFALATLGNCGSDITPPEVTFCANMDNQELVINGAQDVLIRPLIKSDSAGGISKELIQLFISDNNIIDHSTGEGPVRARGNTSNNTLRGNDEDNLAKGEVIHADTAGPNQLIMGNHNQVVMAKALSITNADPNPDGTAVPTGIASVAQFKFATAAHLNNKNGSNDFVLNGIIYEVKATDVEIEADSFVLYTKSDSLITTTCTALDSSGNEIFGTATDNFFVQCEDLESSSVDTEINDGDDATFVLQANITNSNSGLGESTLKTELTNFNDFEKDNTFSYERSHIEWLDQDSLTNESFNWIEYPDETITSTIYKG